jgi:hypothetical protein
VVLGQLQHVVAPHAIHTRVADVRRERVVRTDQQGRERGRHPLLLGVLLGHAVDHVAGLLHAGLEESADLPHAFRVPDRDPLDETVEIAGCAVDPRLQEVGGLPAGDFAFVMATNAVGDDIEAACIIAEERVLVDLTLPANV